DLDLKQVPPANWATFAWCGARGSNSPRTACKAGVLTRERAPQGGQRGKPSVQQRCGRSFIRSSFAQKMIHCAPDGVRKHCVLDANLHVRGDAFEGLVVKGQDKVVHRTPMIGVESKVDA